MKPFFERPDTLDRKMRMLSAVSFGMKIDNKFNSYCTANGLDVNQCLSMGPLDTIAMTESWKEKQRMRGFL